MPISKIRAELIKSLYESGGYDLVAEKEGITNKNTVRRYLRRANFFERLGDESDAANVDIKNVKHMWIKTEDSSIFATNPNYEEVVFDPEKIDWKSIISGLNLIEDKREYPVRIGSFDRVVYTDTHIGMEPNPDGFSLYGGKWGEDELFNRLSDTIGHVSRHQKSNRLVIDDLGDLMDGWDAKTVRREHDLPQNMDNQKAFDVGLRFKWQMFIELSKIYEEIMFNNICMDNHSGSFGYVVNSAFKTMVDSLGNKNYKVNNYRKFIDHYSIGNNVFIISHGKDDKNLKFGFKPKLDARGLEKIDSYIDTYYLLQPNVKIEFSKGDSHQLLFDWSSSDRFNYFNYMAFSPSSSWVQTNFKRGKSGVSMFNYDNEGNSVFIPLFFKWED